MTSTGGDEYFGKILWDLYKDIFRNMYQQTKIF